MHPIEEALGRHAPLILDGGLSTQLELGGADLEDPLWSANVLLEDPDAVRQAHRAFVRAGAEILITASYQVSFGGFAARGLDPTATEDALRASVTLARECADGTAGSAPIVAASVGPYGAILADGSEYRGNYGLSHDELASFHRRRIEILLDAGPDLLAIETVPSITEARALVDVLSHLPDARAWFTFTCADRATLADGSSFAEAMALVASSPRVIAVGVNCTPPTYIEELLRVARSVTDKPLVAYPNRGGDWDPAAKRWLGAEGEGLADLAPTWLQAGAALIGGCCGTDATDIAALSAAVVDRAGSDQAS